MTTATDNLLLKARCVEISASGTTPTVSMLAYSGGMMSVPGWGWVAIDLAGLDLSASQISILADHDASLKGIVGHGHAEVRDGKRYAIGTLVRTTDAARQIIELAKSGFAFQASVGVTPLDHFRSRSALSLAVTAMGTTFCTA